MDLLVIYMTSLLGYVHIFCSFLNWIFSPYFGVWSCVFCIQLLYQTYVLQIFSAIMLFIFLFIHFSKFYYKFIEAEFPLKHFEDTM